MTRFDSTGWFVLAALTVGCSNAEDPSPPTTTDSGSAADAVAETKPDTGPEAETAPPACTSGGTDTRACGKCGRQKRVCTAGAWGAWGVCGDEPTAAECSIGEKRENACGNCGKSTDTCDATECTWILGACTGEGECAPGDEKTSTASCTTLGEVRIFTCDDKCAFSKIGPCGLPKGWVKIKDPTLSARYSGAAVYTGKNPLVWGGIEIDSFGDTNTKADGAIYDVAADTWTTLPDAPSQLSDGRGNLCAAFGDGKLYVWGGISFNTSTPSLTASGASYDPVAKKWAVMSSTGAPSARFAPGCVWSTTTKELIVWGGCTSIDSSGYCTGWTNSGAAYDPAKDTWSALPSAPSGYAGRYFHSMEWSGTDAIIWGGGDDTQTFTNGLRYNATSKSWTTMPSFLSGLTGRINHATVFSGKEMIVFGGSDETISYSYDDGARYTPGGSWSSMTSPTGTELPTPTRLMMQTWYGASKMWVWSGMDEYYTGLKGGASYDPATDKWTTMPTKDEPTPRTWAMVTWTGAEAFVWGGMDVTSGSPVKSGAIFRP